MKLFPISLLSRYLLFFLVKFCSLSFLFHFPTQQIFSKLLRVAYTQQITSLSLSTLMNKLSSFYVKPSSRLSLCLIRVFLLSASFCPKSLTSLSLTSPSLTYPFRLFLHFARFSFLLSPSFHLFVSSLSPFSFLLNQYTIASVRICSLGSSTSF